MPSDTPVTDTRTWSSVSGPRLCFWECARPASATQLALSPHGEIARRREQLVAGVSSDLTYHRYREVVQRREGLWFHHARERREGLLRASHRHSGGGLQVALRRTARRVRRRAGPKGSGGAERRQDLTHRGTVVTGGALFRSAPLLFCGC